MCIAHFLYCLHVIKKKNFVCYWPILSALTFTFSVSDEWINRIKLKVKIINKLNSTVVKLVCCWIFNIYLHIHHFGFISGSCSAFKSWRTTKGHPLAPDCLLFTQGQSINSSISFLLNSRVWHQITSNQCWTVLGGTNKTHSRII